MDAENRDRVSPPHPALRASQLPPALRATSLKEGGFKAPSLRELSAKLTEGVDKLSAKLTEGEDMLTEGVDSLSAMLTDEVDIKRKNTSSVTAEPCHLLLTGEGSGVSPTRGSCQLC